MTDSRSKTLSGIYDIDTQQYEKIIGFTDEIQKNLLVFGNAGIGKTEIPIAYCKRNNIPYVYWNLSTQEAPDLVGIPVEKEGESRVHYLAAPYMPVSDLTKEPVCIIIDEVDKAKPELQNPLLEILQMRTINGRPLNTRGIFMTANLPDEHAFSRPMSHALTNRCMVYRLRTEFAQWRDWATGAGINPLIVAYLDKNQDMLLGKDSDDPTAYCARSPRSWAEAARDVDLLGEGADIDYSSTIIAGRVGQSSASKFKVWLQHYRDIDPIVQAIVGGTIPAAAADLGIDKALICAVAVTSHIQRRAESSRKEEKTAKDAKPSKKTIAEVQKVAKNVSKFLVKLQPEYQFAAIKSSLTARVIMDHGLLDIPDMQKVYDKLHDVVTPGG